MNARLAYDLSWPLRRAAQLHPDREAVVDGALRITYAQLLGRAETMANGVRQLGAVLGDRVGVMSVNSADYLTAYFGIPAGGQVLVPLNQRHADPELTEVLRDCTPRLVIADDEHIERARALAVSCEVRTFAELLHIGNYAPDRTEPATLELGDEIAAIFYTGGTTGRAKGVMLPHASLAANALHMVIGVGYQPEDTYLHCAPMFHLGDGMSVHPVTWVGGRHVFVERFEPAAVLEAIERQRVTCVFLVPAMLTLLLEHLDASDTAFDLSSLRLVLHGGAPIAPALLKRAMTRLGCSFTQSYGMTEAGPILSLLNHEELRLESPTLESAGQPVAGVEVRVVRADGTDCDVGEIGEIVARGPNFATGYWGQPALTTDRFGSGWYRSGDLARLDSERYLYIVGRTGDVIISGGENVYAAEVEAALATHPALLEASVIAVPSERWGEQVHAAVVLRDGASVSYEELEAHCRAHIAGYKIPRSWEIRPTLPRTGVGKIDKTAIRAPHWTGEDRQVS